MKYELYWTRYGTKLKVSHLPHFRLYTHLIETVSDENRRILDRPNLRIFCLL